MKRDALDILIKWKSKAHRKPMIIQGARQVGKTWLAKEFGKSYYKQVAYINFDRNHRVKQVFNDNIDIAAIIEGIQIELKMIIDVKNTLLIFDEIQECPRALASLKYFYEDAPDYHIVAAGSLLGVALTHQGLSFPVGKVDFMELYPLHFYEFLDAIGEGLLCDMLKKGDTSMMASFHKKCIDLLKKYMYIGGMPEVVYNFIENQDYFKVRDLQKTLLKSYENDFGKYIGISDAPKVQMIWDSIPAQLSKPNPKFVYGLLKEGARAKEFENAMLWLQKTGLVYSITKLNKPGLPLFAYEDRSSFKVFMLDIGLLCAKAKLDVRAILEENRIFTEFKGSLTEQYVLQQLKTLSDIAITYWEGRNAEVDFVIQYENDIIPIEVKAATNLQAKSLKVYIDKYAPPISIRTSGATYKVNDNLYDIPLYCIKDFFTFFQKK